MKNLFALSLAALCFVSMSAQAQNLYIRFNMVPSETAIPTGTIGTAIQMDGDTPTDAYLMDAPSDGSDIYSKTLTLPAGNYEYQVVFADGTGSQSTHQASVNAGRQFTLQEEKDVTFRAKIYQPEESQYIKFLCDAQLLYLNTSTTFTTDHPFSAPDENGLTVCSFTYTNYKGAVEVAISPASSTVLTADVLLTAGSKYRLNNAANGKVRWQVSYNRNTLTFNDADVHKLVTLLDTDLIGIGAEATLSNATDLAAEQGTFSNSSPLLLNGGTTSVSARIGADGPAGAEKANDLLKIMPKDIAAYMCYTITQNNEIIRANRIGMYTDADPETPEYETIWQTAEATNISTGLDNGTYNLNIHYETICHNDTVSSNEYSTTFSVSNGTATELAETSVAPRISVNGQNIEAYFNGSAAIRLFSITGQLIDQQHARDQYGIRVEPGLYILSVAGKTHKIIVK